MVLEETGISTAEGYMHSCSVKPGLLNSAAPCEERAFLMSHTPTPSQQWDPPEKPRWDQATSSALWRGQETGRRPRDYDRERIWAENLNTFSLQARLRTPGSCAVTHPWYMAQRSLKSNGHLHFWKHHGILLADSPLTCRKPPPVTQFPNFQVSESDEHFFKNLKLQGRCYSFPPKSLHIPPRNFKTTILFRELIYPK